MSLSQHSPLDLFTDSVWLQSHSEEIVVFCTLLGQCVEIAWPTSNGERIEPNGLRAWLRRRGLYWSCFCPLETGEPMSCQIVHGTYGRVSAYCGQFPSHCGFRLDLSRLHHDAIYESEYQHLPIQPGEHPDMDEILSKYLSATILEELPYVVGYCGEFREGIMQQSGPRRIPGTSWEFRVIGSNQAQRVSRRNALEATPTRQRTLAHQPRSAAYTRVNRRIRRPIIPVATNAIVGPWRCVLLVVFYFLAVFSIIISTCYFLHAA